VDWLPGVTLTTPQRTLVELVGIAATVAAAILAWRALQSIVNDRRMGGRAMSYLEVELQFHPADGDPAAFDGFLDQVLDELAKIGRPQADVAAALAEHSARFTDRVDVDDLDAVERFLSDLRTALHAAECGTPGWPGAVEFRGAAAYEGELAPA
jgi:hypothetical protein